MISDHPVGKENMLRWRCFLWIYNKYLYFYTPRDLLWYFFTWRIVGCMSALVMCHEGGRTDDGRPDHFVGREVCSGGEARTFKDWWMHWCSDLSTVTCVQVKAWCSQPARLGCGPCPLVELPRKPIPQLSCDLTENVQRKLSNHGRDSTCVDLWTSIFECFIQQPEGRGLSFIYCEKT